MPKTPRKPKRVRIKTEMRLMNVRLPKGIKTPRTKMPKSQRKFR